MAVYDAKEKVFLITGAASGIGAAVVKAFLDNGAKHIAVLDMAEEAGKALENALNKEYGPEKVRFFKCDVTNDDQLFHAYDKTLEDHGYIDVVVNNAGIMNDHESVYKKQVEINVTALATSTFKAFKIMRKDNGGKGGTIINISSVAALTQGPLLPLYFATKCAVLQFTLCLGLQPTYEATGVRMVTVCFGPTDTALFSKAKIGGYDQEMDSALKDEVGIRNVVYLQRKESAVNGVVEAFKRSTSGGTWIACNDHDPEDITDDVTKAFEILGSRFEASNKRHEAESQK